MNENSVGCDDSAKNLSNIEFKNQSIDSSFRSLSRGEEFLQKDILQVLNCQPAVSLINLFYINFIYRKTMKMEVVLKIITMKVIIYQNYPLKILFKVKEVKILY